MVWIDNACAVVIAVLPRSDAQEVIKVTTRLSHIFNVVMVMLGAVVLQERVVGLGTRNAEMWGSRT